MDARLGVFINGGLRIVSGLIVIGGGFLALTRTEKFATRFLLILIAIGVRAAICNLTGRAAQHVLAKR